MRPEVDDSHLSIIIPAYNEERRIGPTVEQYAAHFPAAEIIVVLNGCTDSTVEVVRTAASVHPNVKLLSIPAKVGKGGAVRAGMVLAHGTVIGFVDADGSFQAEEFEKLVTAL